MHSNFPTSNAQISSLEPWSTLTMSSWEALQSPVATKIQKSSALFNSSLVQKKWSNKSKPLVIGLLCGGAKRKQLHLPSPTITLSFRPTDHRSCLFVPQHPQTTMPRLSHSTELSGCELKSVVTFSSLTVPNLMPSGSTGSTQLVWGNTRTILKGKQNPNLISNARILAIGGTMASVS